MNDFRFALRQLLKNPGFTAVAVLTLAVGFLISHSVRPGNAQLLFVVQPRDHETSGHHSNHGAHSLGLGVKSRVTKKPAKKVRRLILTDRLDDQTISSMTKQSGSKSQISREERRTRKGEQKGNDLLVGHALATPFDPDVPDGNPPASQQKALALQNVFIKDVHVLRSHSEFVSVFTEGLPGRADRLGDGFLGDATAPFLNNTFPSHPRRDLLEHIRHENPRASKRRLPVANLRIRDDVAANDFLFHSATINTSISLFRQRSGLPQRLAEPVRNSDQCNELTS